MSEQEIREGMLLAVWDEPPLDFDPDTLIKRVEQKKSRRRALVGVGVATAMIAVVSFALPGLLPRGSDGQLASENPTSSSAPPRPCLSDARYRVFDFWVGEWDVRPTKRPEQPPSQSRIEKIEDGCVIYEQYTTAQGYSGRSFNAYDPERKEWQQFYVDNTGGIHHYRGQAKDGNLYFEAAAVSLPGEAAPVRLKMTFVNQGPDKLRQHFQKSSDGGKTWQPTWDFTYTRRGSQRTD